MRKFIKSKKAMGILSLCLGLIMVGTGIAAAAGLISNTWTSPSVVVTVKPLIPVPLVISSNLDGGGDLAKYIGDDVHLTITIKNYGPVGYTGIKTHTSIYRTDGTPIAVGDITLYDEWPAGTWRNLTSYLTLIDDATAGRGGKALSLVTNTADITALGGTHDTDITPLKVIFNTAGTYQASSYSTN